MFSQIPLILFFIVIAVNLWYVFAIIYHLIRFGIGVEPKLTALVFLIGSIIFFLVVFAFFTRVDWQNISKITAKFLKTYLFN